MAKSEVHAIGDDAAEAVLEAFEKAGVRPEDRPILTHCQILGPDLMDTMARLGVIANVQPQVRSTQTHLPSTRANQWPTIGVVPVGWQFVTTDSLWLHKRVQPEVLPYCYAWKTMLDKGESLAGHNMKKEADP
jgi:predicted amidohydrolase YtcJ